MTPQTLWGRQLALHAIGWGVGNGWMAGVGGHVFKQTTADNGPNASSSKAQAFAIGPSVRFRDGKGWLVTAKLQKEFRVKNRPSGTQLYVKATLPF